MLYWIFIDDYCDYVLSWEALRYAEVLRNALTYKDVEQERLFLMKNLHAMEVEF